MQIEEIIVQIERLVRVGLIIVVTYLLALWIAAIWWTFQDIRNRSTDLLLQIAATLLVTIFSFPGLLIYFMLRPQRTLAELYDESLEEEALLRSLPPASTCPSCENPVEPDFLFCPWCQDRLRQLCSRCERPIALEWQICPYCGAAPQTTVTIVPAQPPPRELVNR
jgi:hypothetical protein